MRSTYLAAGALSLLGLFAACGSDDHAPTAGDPTRGGSAGKSTGTEGGDDGSGTGGSKGGKGGSGGTLNRAGSGGVARPVGGDGAGGDGMGGDGNIAVGAPPTVTIITPSMPVTDPSGGNVIVNDSAEVTCRAVEGVGEDAQPVDETSVQVAVLGPGNAPIAPATTATKKAGTDEYVATVSLTNATTGKVSFLCTAKSTGNAEGEAQVAALVDRGPKLTPVAPVASSTPLGLTKPLTFQFKAEPAKLAATDPQADVNPASVTLSLNGLSITPKLVGSVWEAKDVDLTKLNPKPEGKVTVALSAANSRKPDFATASTSYEIVVDGTGPTVDMHKPADHAVVGGLVTIDFDVTDPSGIDEQVFVTVEGVSHLYNDVPTNWAHVAGTTNYKYTFDSREPAYKDSPQINVSASATDRLGNKTTGDKRPIYLDNVGPQVDLDPAKVRTRDNGNCSAAFDPVGAFVPNDASKTTGNDKFRVLVWERTTESSNPNLALYFSKTDLVDHNVTLFFRKPGSSALLVNSKAAGTGVCDDIESTAAEAVNLSPLSEVATPTYNGDSITAPTSSCSGFPNGSTASPLCGDDKGDMTQALFHHDNLMNEAAIYGYSPLPIGNDCTGQAFGYAQFADKDGWVCVAARAYDVVGNVGVSPPLRLCLSAGGTAGCATTNKTPPSCTDGCTPPPRGGGFVTKLKQTN